MFNDEYDDARFDETADEFEPTEPTTETGIDDVSEDYPGQRIDGSETARCQVCGEFYGDHGTCVTVGCSGDDDIPF